MTKTESKTKLKCPECGKATLQAKVADVSAETHGETFKVSMDALVCPKCAFKTIPTGKMGEFALRIADQYRRGHGLLTSSQIKARRLGLGMSQQQFATYLGAGVASIKRWELGQVQDEAMNSLMVLKTDLAAAKRNVAEIATQLGKPIRRPADLRA
jgi:putative zinc finger/helix-turn-helix YgiT family protein